MLINKPINTLQLKVVVGKKSVDVEVLLCYCNDDTCNEVISGAEKVVISKSGNVRGNIVAPRVTLEDGAKFKGSIDMDPGEASTSTVSLASQRSSDGPSEDLAGTPLGQKSG